MFTKVTLTKITKLRATYVQRTDKSFQLHFNPSVHYRYHMSRLAQCPKGLVLILLVLLRIIQQRSSRDTGQMAG
jgi:hypothetical protein